MRLLAAEQTLRSRLHRRATFVELIRRLNSTVKPSEIAHVAIDEAALWIPGISWAVVSPHLTGQTAVLAARGTHLLTPHKRRRNEPEMNIPTLLNRFVSSMRQPLESLFGWMIQRTDLQNASRVRSTKGLLAHCYGKLAVACLLLTFYS